MNQEKRVTEYEHILDRAQQTAAQLESALRAYEEIQDEVKALETYYAGPEWKEDFAADEAGQLPADLKRGVLSEDGIYNLLERSREIGRELGKAVDEESETC